MRPRSLPALALALVAGCACGRGATPTPAPAPPPDAGEPPIDAPPVGEPDAGAPLPAPVDAAPAVDAAPSTSGGSGYRKQWLIKCVITTVDEETIGFTCERAVKRGWKGDLWNDDTNKAVSGSRFQVLGSRPPDRLTAVARLLHPLSVFGPDIKTVRIVEEF